ncbi:AcrB/AcrD/AcrF family protein, partial [Candidatus Peregrinibacteria bacterium]|nr:AcrB/AcrD/AcrF family protein [Candidatus Peregrinibacteria bacterium]
MNSQTNEKLEKMKKSCWSFFIERRPIAWLVVIGIITAGIFSVISLPKEIQPEVDIPFVGVTTTLPGAGPSDTESLITEPLENKILNVDNIENLSSTSGFGYSSIFIEFDAKTEIDKALQDVKDAADIAKTELPD